MLVGSGPVYRTKESASSVVGRDNHGTAAYKSGNIGYSGHTRGERALGEAYRDNCGCTVEEVFDNDWTPTPTEAAFVDLYNQAVQACKDEGLPVNAKNVTAKMRQHGHGIINDAVAPKTATGGGSGRGGKPPRRYGMLGSHGPDEFPEINGWRAPVRRSQIDEFDDTAALGILDGRIPNDGHGHHRFGSGRGKSEFPEGWGENEVIQWVREVMDFPGDIVADPDGFDIYSEARGVRGKVCVRTDGHGTWWIATAYPKRQNRVMTFSEWASGLVVRYGSSSAPENEQEYMREGEWSLVAYGALFRACRSGRLTEADRLAALKWIEAGAFDRKSGEALKRYALQA